jgi:hypothetical protein
LKSFGSLSGSGSSSGTRQYLALFSNKKKFEKNLAQSMSEAALFLRKPASDFGFFIVFFIFDSDPNPVPEL